MVLWGTPVPVLLSVLIDALVDMPSFKPAVCQVAPAHLPVRQAHVHTLAKFTGTSFSPGHGPNKKQPELVQ